MIDLEAASRDICWAVAAAVSVKVVVDCDRLRATVVDRIGSFVVAGTVSMGSGVQLNLAG